MLCLSGFELYSRWVPLSRSVCKWRVQPCDSDLKERFLSFVCLFIYFFCHSHFSFFPSYFFWYPHFFHPHFSIRIFPSASAIRRYPVRVLQTPSKHFKILEWQVMNEKINSNSMRNMYKINTSVLIQERAPMNVSKNHTICSLMDFFSANVVNEQWQIINLISWKSKNPWSYSGYH